MRLRKQLQELKSQQQAELANLGRGYAQAKHDLDPARLIRKYPAATLGAAAVAGMMIAPRPTPRYVFGGASEGKGKRSRRGGRFGWVLKVIRGVLPAEAAAFIPEGTEASGAAAQENGHGGGERGGASKSPLDGVLEFAASQAIGYLLTQINVAEVVQAWVEGMRNKGKKSEVGVENSGSGEVERADDIGTPS